MKRLQRSKRRLSGSTVPQATEFLEARTLLSGTAILEAADAPEIASIDDAFTSDAWTLGSRRGEVETVVAKNVGTFLGRSSLLGTSASGKPWFARNTSDSPQTVERQQWDAGAFLLHPGPADDATVTWTASSAGAVEIDLSLDDFLANAGDGVSYQLLHQSGGETETISQGVMPNGGSVVVADSTVLNVADGDRIQLVIQAPGTAARDAGSHNYDWTQVEFTVSQTEQIEPESDADVSRFITDIAESPHQREQLADYFATDAGREDAAALQLAFAPFSTSRQSVAVQWNGSITARDGKLFNSQPNWDRGFGSSQTFTGPGSIEVVPGPGRNHQIFGISTTAFNDSKGWVQYGMHVGEKMHAGGNLHIFADGLQTRKIWSPNDRLKLEYDGDSITMYRNGTQFFTRQVGDLGEWVFDIHAHEGGEIFSEVQTTATVTFDEEAALDAFLATSEGQGFAASIVSEATARDEVDRLLTVPAVSAEISNPVEPPDSPVAVQVYASLWHNQNQLLEALRATTASLSGEIEGHEIDLQSLRDQLTLQTTSIAQLEVREESLLDTSDAIDNLARFRLLGGANRNQFSVALEDIPAGVDLGVRYYGAQNWRYREPVDAGDSSVRIPVSRVSAQGSRRLQVGLISRHSGEIISPLAAFRTWKVYLLQGNATSAWRELDGSSVLPAEVRESLLADTVGELSEARARLQSLNQRVLDTQSQLTQLREQNTAVAELIETARTDVAHARQLYLDAAVLHGAEIDLGAVNYGRFVVETDGGLARIRFSSPGDSTFFEVERTSPFNQGFLYRDTIDHVDGTTDSDFAFNVPTGVGMIEVRMWDFPARENLLDKAVLTHLIDRSYFRINKALNDLEQVETGRLVSNPVSSSVRVVGTDATNALVLLTNPADQSFVRIEGDGFFSSRTIPHVGGTTGSVAMLTIASHLSSGNYRVQLFRGSENGVLLDEITVNWNQATSELTPTADAEFERTEYAEMLVGTLGLGAEQRDEFLTTVNDAIDGMLQRIRTVQLNDNNLRHKQRIILGTESPWYVSIDTVAASARARNQQWFADDAIDRMWQQNRNASRGSVQDLVLDQQRDIMRDVYDAHGSAENKLGELVEQAIQTVIGIRSSNQQEGSHEGDLINAFRHRVTIASERMPGHVVWAGGSYPRWDMLLRYASNLLDSSFNATLSKLQDSQQSLLRRTQLSPEETQDWIPENSPVDTELIGAPSGEDSPYPALQIAVDARREARLDAMSIVERVDARRVRRLISRGELALWLARHTTPTSTPTSSEGLDVQPDEARLDALLSLRTSIEERYENELIKISQSEAEMEEWIRIVDTIEPFINVVKGAGKLAVKNSATLADFARLSWEGAFEPALEISLELSTPEHEALKTVRDIASGVLHATSLSFWAIEIPYGVWHGEMPEQHRQSLRQDVLNERSTQLAIVDAMIRDERVHLRQE